MTERTVTTLGELKSLAGEEIAVGDWFEITQERVNAFADATGDHQWIHVDTERAKTSSFGGTIAHGFLTLSMTPLLKSSDPRIAIELPAKMGVNYGLNRVRFMSPVRVGKRVRSRTTLVSVEDVATNICQLINQVTIEIEGEAKPAMVAEMISRYYL